jgi:hypothetical protein
VIERTFLGPTLRLVVETAAQQRLTVLTTEMGSSGSVGPDAAVDLSFAAGDAVLLRPGIPAS